MQIGIIKNGYRTIVGGALVALLCVGTLLPSCSNGPRPEVSFYYWKSRFTLGSTERQALESNNVQKLYVRYFDVDIHPLLGRATPLAVVKGDSLPRCTIIPVVFIKNRVFDGASPLEVDSLSQKVAQLVGKINQNFGITPPEMQFDCDWTVKTKDAYFEFLKKYRALTRQTLSATIRLHQVKYPKKTGVPPIDRGVLMYYNMGKISADSRCSIYDREIAQKYISSVGSYPLPLDIALPIFTWGIQIRQNMVVHLLNKMNDGHFANDPHFKKVASNRYRVSEPCFKGGYYFKQGDEVKIETISDEELNEMAKDIRQNLKAYPQNLIFYDLDSINIKQYEIKVYQKLANRMR
jgi:hypothetical protein